MPRSLSNLIFLSSNKAAPQPAFKEILARDAELAEDWFQEAIEKEPGLVIAPCIAGDLTDDEKWFFWRKELVVKNAIGKEAGRIDVLLVSESGRIAIVETKLFKNPESRRIVVAQILDYATNLPEMTVSQIGPLPGGKLVAEDYVEASLRAGDFLLIIAGDRIDERAVRLGQAMLDGHLTRRWSLATVNLSLFRSTHDPSQLLVVPNLAGALVPEVRQHVQIRVDVVGAENATVTQSMISVEPTEVSPARIRWNEQRFFESLDKAPLDERIKTFGRKLRELRDRHPSLRLDWGTGKVVGSATLKRNGASLLEFYLDGRFQFRRDKFFPALGDFAGSYEKGLRERFPKAMEMDYPNVHPPQSAEKAEALLVLIETVLRDAERQS